MRFCSCSVSFAVVLKNITGMRRWLRPTLELVGIYGGVKDGIKTIVPATATLKMVARLVPNQNPDKVLKVGGRVPSWAVSGTWQGPKCGPVSCHPASTHFCASAMFVKKLSMFSACHV